MDCGLLFKLKLNLPTPFYLLLKSYLNERTFFVSVNDEESDIGEIKSGVPQGSVLGPTLYTLFTSDMPTNNDVTIETYAADTAILATDTSPIDASVKVQCQLNVIESWCKKWKINIDADKSIEVTYTLKKGNCPSVTFNGVTIPSADSAKYLGLHIDRRLNWKHHIKQTKEQLNIKTKKCFGFLDPSHKLVWRTKYYYIKRY